MTKSLRTAAILVAAGRGLRAGAGGPKQYRMIGGQTVIYRAMEAFCRNPDVAAVQPVLHPDDIAMFNTACTGLRHEPPTPGGATRQASVHAGLEALARQKPDIVLIHDAARPFVSPAVISRAIDAAMKTGAAMRLEDHIVFECLRGLGDSQACPFGRGLDMAGAVDQFDGVVHGNGRNRRAGLHGSLDRARDHGRRDERACRVMD